MENVHTPQKPCLGSKLGYTRLEAALIIGQSPATIDRLTKRGLLHPWRATRRPIYPYWELERFLRDTIEIAVRATGGEDWELERFLRDTIGKLP